MTAPTPWRARNPVKTAVRYLITGTVPATTTATLAEREIARRTSILSRTMAITVILSSCLLPTCLRFGVPTLLRVSLATCIAGQVVAFYAMRKRGLTTGGTVSIAIDLLTVLMFESTHQGRFDMGGIPYQAFLAVPVLKAGIVLGGRATVATGAAAIAVGILGVANHLRLEESARTPYVLFMTYAPLFGAMILTVVLSVVYGASVTEALSAEEQRRREMEEKGAELSHMVEMQQQAAETAQRRAQEVDQLNSLLFQMQQRVETSYAELEEANRLLARQATTDALTGLTNHRAFQDALRNMCDAASRTDAPLALLMIDVDHFKTYNDTYGHPAGDQVLNGIGSLLLAASRKSDTPARYGGEEFAMLLPGTDVIEAVAFAEQLRQAVENKKFGQKTVTVSIGVAVRPLHATESRSLLCAADNALYNAKRYGRNQVQVSDASPKDAMAPLDAESRAIAARVITEFPTIDWSEVIPPAAPKQDFAQFGGIEGLLQQPAAATLSELVAALDVRNQEPCGHSLRLARYSVHLLKSIMAAPEGSPVALDASHGDIHAIAMGALLHDLGKLYVPQYMLRNQVQLNSDEQHVLRRHPVTGAELVSAFAGLQAAEDAVRYHHERWDGEGYPEHLRGTEIPLVARVLAVCDAFEKMTSSRVPTPTSTYAAACAEMQRSSGTYLDPHVVEAFLAVPVEEWVALGMPAPPVHLAA